MMCSGRRAIGHVGQATDGRGTKRRAATDGNFFHNMGSMDMDNVSLERSCVGCLKCEEAAKLLGMTIQRLGFLLREGRFHGAAQVGERKDWFIPVESVRNFSRKKAGRKKKFVSGIA